MEKARKRSAHDVSWQPRITVENYWPRKTTNRSVGYRSVDVSTSTTSSREPNVKEKNVVWRRSSRRLVRDFGFPVFRKGYVYSLETMMYKIGKMTASCCEIYLFGIKNFPYDIANNNSNSVSL